MPTPAIDPEDFDVETWIAGLARPERTVILYPPNEDLRTRAVDLEGRLARAEDEDPGQRGINDAGPEQIRAQLDALRQEWEATAMRVRVRELLPTERDEVVAAAREAGVEDITTINLWVVSAACVAPKLTPAQLEAMAKASRAGDAMVAQLIEATSDLALSPVTAPFSPGSSTDPS